MSYAVAANESGIETVEEYVERVGLKKALFQYRRLQENWSLKYDQYEQQRRSLKSFLDKHDPEANSEIDEEILIAGLQLLQEKALAKLKPLEDAIEKLEQMSV